MTDLALKQIDHGQFDIAIDGDLVHKTIKIDTFTEGVDTPLEDHVSDSGGGWSGNSVNSISVNNTGEAYAEAALTYAGIGDENPVSPNQQCTVVGSVNINGGFGAIVRGFSDDTGYRGYLISSGKCVLAKYTSSIFTVIDFVPVPDFSLATEYAVTLQVINNTLKVFVDNVELISARDSTITDAGNVGIYLQGTDARITSITATAIVSDGYDLATDDGLQATVIILLFTDKGQWWGDQYLDQPLGSELYKLDTAKATQQTLNDAEQYATEALQPLIDQGVAKSVEATAEYGGSNGDILGLLITITRPDGNADTFKFNDVWEAQLNA